MIFNNFLGCDVAKNKIDIAFHNKNQTFSIQNNVIGIKKFIKEYKFLLQDSFVVIDHTGGYEKLLTKMILSHVKAVHISDGRCVKSFIRSFGIRAKTDKIDAKMLALYGQDRHEKLRIYNETDEELINLQKLTQRYSDLSEMQQKEKNRFKAPEYDKASCKRSISFFQKEIDKIEHKISELINKNGDLKKKAEACQKIKGVGEKTAFKLLALLPELGMLNRREIAALSGVAPYSFDSGQMQGRRHTRAGRKGVKEVLFMAGLVGTRYDPKLKKFYEELQSRGKAKKVALVACLRKIIIEINWEVKQVINEKSTI